MTDPVSPFDESDASHAAKHGPEKKTANTQTVRRLRLAARKNMRQGLTTFHWSLIVAGLIAVGVAGWFLAEGNAPDVRSQWFYDLKTGQLFIGENQQVAPIKAPSDGQGSEQSGVLAQVIRVEGVDELQVVSLVTHTPEAKALREANTPGMPPTDGGKVLEGMRVAKPPLKPGDPIVWVQATSGEGQGIFMQANTIAGGKPFTVDLPE